MLDLILVFTEPVVGREDEYNEWYDHTHLRDVLAIPAVVSAERFSEAGGSGYLAIYQVEGDAEAVIRELRRRWGSEQLLASGALDLTKVSMTVWRSR